MGVVGLPRRLHGAKYPQRDLTCFPLRIRRYSRSVTEKDGRLPVSVESVKAFFKSCLASGTPTWHRLQAVRAVEAYRGLVLGTGEPGLGEVRQVLQRLAAEEHDHAAAGAAGASRPGVEDERHLVGVSD